MMATKQKMMYHRDWLYSTISLHTSSAKPSSNTEKLSPLDFDNFIPWLCRQLHVPRNITVIRKQQEDYEPLVIKRSSSTKSRFKDLKVKTEPMDFTESIESSSSSSITSTRIQNDVPITAYYNAKGQLVQLALFDYYSPVTRKVIKAISFCLPFHTTLQKLDLKKRIHKAVLYEISNILPYSNITDICLDDSILPEGNYYLLLQKVNQLKNLSLRRCDINDDVCGMIVEMMNFGNPASETLLVLDMASNRITNIGAMYLAKMLRSNRTLMHLNISDNRITDIGALRILEKLSLFPLRKEEVLGLNRRRLAFFYKQKETRKKYKEEILHRLEDEDKENRVRKKRSTITKRETSMKSKIFEEHLIDERVEKMVEVIVGEFKDIFDNRNTTRLNGQLHSIGNMRLCSLNLAFNNLSYFFVRKVQDVLEYQSDLQKPQDTGLLRIILDGNNIPKKCKELGAIEALLEIVVSKNEIKCKTASTVKVSKRGARHNSRK